VFVAKSIATRRFNSPAEPAAMNFARVSSLIVLLLCLAVTALVAGCEKPSAPPPPVAVEVVVAKPITKRIVEWDEYTGRLEPIEFVEVRARVGGYLKEIHFIEGQIIQKGDLLCVIDEKPYKSAVRRAEAALQEAKAAQGQAESELVQSVAAKEDVKAQYVLEDQRYHRAEQLVGTNAISPEEFDIRKSTLAQAKAKVESAEANIETARAAVEVAIAAVAAAEAELNTANINLGYTQVKSPISGRVSSRVVTVGNLISGGTAESTLLTTIVSLNPIHVVFDADEAAFLKYQRLSTLGKRASSRDVKNPVYLSLADEFPKFPHTGHMDFVDNRLDPNTGTMRGRAILRNDDYLLTPGLFARVRLPGSGAYEAILVSDASVISDQSDKFVYVVDGEGNIKRQTVKIGSTINGLRIVHEGLKGDEQLIIRGMQRVRPGLKAKVTEEELQIKNDEGLPDNYEPVPEAEWISREASFLPPLRSDRPVRTAGGESLRQRTASP
jgi:RND family efflux transporter MFP subunit